MKTHPFSLFAASFSPRSSFLSPTRHDDGLRPPRLLSIKIILPILFGLIQFTPSLHASPFSAGDLAVLRSGDGTTTLTNISTAFFLGEYRTNGQLVQTIAIPSSGSNALVLSGDAVAEASLTRTANGRWLCFTGYHAEPGFTNIPGSTSTQAPRSIATIDGAGMFNLVSASPTLFNTFSIRAAASDGTNGFWGGGANSGTAAGGICYFGFNGPTNTIYGSTVRVLKIINGNLYASASGSGVMKFAGYPKTASTPSTVISETGSPYGFAINPTGNIAYVADDTQSSVGGVLRYTNSTGTWSLVYTLGTGVTNVGARGLNVDWSGSNPIIYATTSDNTVYGNPTNRLIRIVDSGSHSVATTLATAPGCSSFRGVTFVPEYYQLEIALNGNNLAVTPSTNSLGAILETATTLTSPGQWTPVWTNSGQPPPTFPVANQQFFRLRLPQSISSP